MAPQGVQEREQVAREIQTAVRHTAVYGVGSIAIKALSFLMLPFYTHYLTPADYGILEILDLSMSLFGMVLHMGIAPALLRVYAGARTGEEKRTVVSTATAFIFTTGLLTFVAGVGLMAPLTAVLFGAGVSSKYLLLSFASFVLSYLTTTPRAYLRAIEASGRFTLLESGSLLAMLALNIVFIAGFRIGAIGILWSALIVNSVQTVWLSGWIVRVTGLRFDRKFLRQIVAFGLPLTFSNVALFALNFSDRFFLQRLESLDAVGIYAVGYKLAFMINYLLVQPFYAMWQARMYAIHARSDHRTIFRQVFIMYSLVLTYAALAIAVCSREIVSLMADPKFAAGRDVVPVVALAYVFYGVGLFLQLGMFLTERTKAVGGVGTAAAILNLGLNYLLIQKFGMMGAAWATALGFLAIAAGSYWYSERALPLQLGVGRAAAALAVAGCIYVVSAIAAPRPMGPAIGFKSLCLLAFPVLVWKLRILSVDEVATLLSFRRTATSTITRRLGWSMGR